MVVCSKLQVKECPKCCSLILTCLCTLWLKKLPRLTLKCQFRGWYIRLKRDLWEIEWATMYAKSTKWGIVSNISFFDSSCRSQVREKGSVVTSLLNRVILLKIWVQRSICFLRCSAAIHQAQKFDWRATCLPIWRNLDLSRPSARVMKLKFHQVRHTSHWVTNWLKLYSTWCQIPHNSI